MKSETVKVMPWGKGQGEYVEINAADFDPAKHKPYPPATESEVKPRGNKRGLDR
jgi:hypothetical protein